VPSAIAGDAVKETIHYRAAQRQPGVGGERVERHPGDAHTHRSDTPTRTTASSFERILALLTRSPADFPIVVTGETQPKENPELLIQSTLVQGGTLEAGKTVSVTIPIDVARQASFMLYAPGSNVTMQIKTVAGKILDEETPKTNQRELPAGLDASVPLSLGYGVIDPKAGPWEIGLTASETPPGGGPFAVMATVESDLRMAAEATPGVTAVGQPVTLRAALQAPEAPQEVQATAQVRLEGSDAAPVEIEMSRGDDGALSVTIIPDEPGDWTAIIALTGRDAAGNPFERLSVLGVVAQ
jgi:hypothetical protein